MIHCSESWCKCLTIRFRNKNQFSILHCIWVFSKRSIWILNLSAKTIWNGNKFGIVTKRKDTIFNNYTFVYSHFPNPTETWLLSFHSSMWPFLSLLISVKSPWAQTKTEQLRGAKDNRTETSVVPNCQSMAFQQLEFGTTGVLFPSHVHIQNTYISYAHLSHINKNECVNVTLWISMHLLDQNKNQFEWITWNNVKCIKKRIKSGWLSQK